MRETLNPDARPDGHKPDADKPEAGESFLSHGPSLDGKALVTRDHVAAWWLPLDEIAEADWPALEALLIEEERERSRRFHFERDRLVYVAAHAMVRALLSYCLGGAPSSWRFSVGEHGKPELVPTHGMPRIRVNLSHTNGLAAAALTIDHDIGVDVEWLERTVECEKLAQRVFAEHERRVLAATAPESRLDTFLTFWTLKEAYVKAIGKGLSQPLAAFFFDLPSARIHFDDTLVDDATQWRFERHRPSARHLMAIAVKHPEPAKLTFDVEPARLAWMLRAGERER